MVGTRSSCARSITQSRAVKYFRPGEEIKKMQYRSPQSPPYSSLLFQKSATLSVKGPLAQGEIPPLADCHVYTGSEPTCIIGTHALEAI